MTSTPIKRRSKGEQSRKLILRSAIEMLALHGIKGTTHRAVASHAGTQLSLTTYYFKDINELITQAFELNSENTIAQAESAWQEAFAVISNSNIEQGIKLKEQLTELAISYLVKKINDEPVALAVEQLLFTQTKSFPLLAELAKNHKATLLEPFIKLCQALGSNNAIIDADIMFTVFTQLEYRSINSNSELDVPYIKATVERLISLLVTPI